MREVGNKVSGWREHRREDVGFEIGVEFRLVRESNREGERERERELKSTVHNYLELLN